MATVVAILDFWSANFYIILMYKTLCCYNVKFYSNHPMVQGHITKTCLYNFDPLKPHFYIVKLGFTGVYIIFLISAPNIDCGYSLEPPRRGGSNEYPQYMFWAEIRKISEFFLSEKFQFLEMNCSIYLNRCVFIMSHQKLMWWPFWISLLLLYLLVGLLLHHKFQLHSQSGLRGDVENRFSNWQNFCYFRSRSHPVTTVCFNSNRPTVWEEKSKTGFKSAWI